MNKKIFISVLAVLANIILAIGKIIVGTISKSAAIFADGINSGTDVVSSIISYIGIKTAEKPADKEHPYGHEKAEVIAGFVITIIIFLSALFIIYDAIKSFFIPSVLNLSYLAFGVMGLSALINFIMSQIKIHYGKKYDSVSLISDGIHSRIDLLVSIGIFAGLFLIRFYSGIDSILALFVGLYIMKEAFALGKETTDSLIGSSAGEELEEKIKEIIRKQNIDLIKLKTQKIGRKIFAEISIKLAAKIKVEQATSITKKLERNLINNIDKLEYISIQIESHDVETGYYKPLLGLGRGFGWQRKGRFKEKIPEAKALGPGGFCVCEKCGYKVEHERGKPCSLQKCPKCNLPLTRGEIRGMGRGMRRGIERGRGNRRK